MDYIRTVTGDIPQNTLGWCQCHEHIFLADGPSRQINKALYLDDYEKSLGEVLLYKKAGGQSFVDAQPFGCGRMVKELFSVSQHTGVNIISCTGFHKEEFFEDREWLTNQTEEALTSIYIDEIQYGMYAHDKSETTSKAGIIKCAAIKGEHKANSEYEKLFNSVANAAVVTGVPIMIHMDNGADAFPIITFFGKKSIKPNRLLFCHLDRTRHDYAYHEELAATGSFLEYDTIHREKYHSNEKEAALIAHMIKKGHVNNLLLGMDSTNQRLKSYGATFGLDYILTEFIFLLEKYISKELVERIMIQNPANALSFSVEG
jgi:phosphotriesterase-related protein